MKRLIIILAFILTAYIGVIANVRVLSIGISEYPESSGWNKINAHNDVELMTSLFPNASSLENAEATRSGIERQLNTLAKNAAQGDTVIIHFSGHGQQIITLSSSDEADGVDEAIVPYDAGKRKTSSYRGQNHLTDDVFGNVIDNLRRAVGPNGLVIAIIDACHSDSMDKAADDTKDTYRGTDEIFGAESMSGEKIDSLQETYHNQDTTALNVSTDMSNAVYISACRSDQRNYEVTVDGKGYGSLTYYFCKAYQDKGITDIPVFLSAIYSGMENDENLKFHGQVPSIRNTVGWMAPKKVITIPPKFPNRPDESDNSSSQTLIPTIIAVALIVIFSAIWIARKKKK